MGIHKNTYRSFSNVIGLILLSHFVFSQHDSSLKKYEAGIHFDCIRNFVKVSFPPSGVKNRSGWALGAFYQRKIALNYWGRIETNYTLSGFFDEKYGALNDLFFLQTNLSLVFRRRQISLLAGPAMQLLVNYKTKEPYVAGYHSNGLAIIEYRTVYAPVDGLQLSPVNWGIQASLQYTYKSIGVRLNYQRFFNAAVVAHQYLSNLRGQNHWNYYFSSLQAGIFYRII